MSIQFRARIDKASAEALRKKIEDIPNAITRTDAEKMGEDAVASMKQLIATGSSPISGPGIDARFASYKNPKKYPGGVSKRFPGKRVRPVNLYLSGSFIAALTYRAIKTVYGYGVSIGYDGRKQQLKELGHREGANGQPSRPTIPQAGELFVSKIQSALRSAVVQAIDRVARRR